MSGAASPGERIDEAPGDERIDEAPGDERFDVAPGGEHIAPAEPYQALPVRARGLVKRYDEVLAVDHIDLHVRAGDVYGFLGPNGAGKTTTLRMALGLISPSEGSVELFGRDPMRDGAAALQGVAGFVEAPRFYPYLTGRKNLELLAALDGGDASTRIGEALETVDLAPRAKHKVGGYSHGMRQRLGIAAALLRDPQLLILDEPATGLDPAGMRDMRLLIERLSGEGITVLLSSHQLPEVQELCDRVAIVNRGRIVYEGALNELRQMAGASHRLHTSDDARARQIASAAADVEVLESESRELCIRGPEQAIGELSLALAAANVAIFALTPELATLEDLFFRLTENREPGTAEGRAPAREQALSGTGQ